jgi:hypothetical protein
LKRRKLEKELAAIMEASERLRMYQLHMRLMTNDIDTMQSKVVRECDEDGYALDECQSSDLLKNDVHRLASDSRKVNQPPDPFLKNKERNKMQV